MLVGLCGLARSGKDSFFNIVKDNFEGGFHRVAFADALKRELDDLLIKYTRISAFTEKREEKEIIRPLLVTYGTHVRRRLNENCWIERIENNVKHHLNAGKCVFVTDVRYENELRWIHQMNGASIYIETPGNYPTNEEEEINDPILKFHAKHCFSWKKNAPSIKETPIKIKNFFKNKNITLNG
jgi:hypothetical protein